MTEEAWVLMASVVERATATVDRGASDELAARQILGYVQRHWRDLSSLGVRSARDLAALRVTVVGSREAEGATLEQRVTLDLSGVPALREPNPST